MGFVPRLFNKPGFFISIFCLSLITSNTFASTKILVWGDSLSAAYRIPIEQGWVSLLQHKLSNSVEIVNGSISGETTQGGLTRFATAVESFSPHLVILELGANDGLRGISPHVTKNNLEQIIQQAKGVNAEVMLLGMKIPPNYGPIYTKLFESQFKQLADKYQLPFIPFFLEKVILDPSLIQADQLHPNAKAQPIILDSIMPTLKETLQKIHDNNPSKNIENKGISKENTKSPA